MWMMEQVRVTARRLGSSVTLLGGAPDPYEQRMIKSATPTLRPTFPTFSYPFSAFHFRELDQTSLSGFQSTKDSWLRHWL